MSRRQGVSLVNKAVGLGMVTALLVIAVTDVAFFSAHALHISRQWDSMYEAVINDWSRMCEQALSGRRMEVLQRQAGLILSGPMKVEAAYLSDARGKLLAHSDPNLVGSSIDAWRKASRSRPMIEKTQAVRFPDGTRGLSAVAYLQPSKGDVRALIHRQQAEMLTPVLAANLVLLILIALVSIITARTIIRPVKALAGAVKRVSQGDLMAMVQVGGSDELSALERSFNTMALRLREVDELKTEFLAKITHDLRNPLSGIRGHAELLRMEVRGPLSESQKNSLDSIIRSSDSLALLINNILDMTAMEAGRMSYARAPTDMAELLASVSNLMRGQAENCGIALEARLESDLPRINADSEALRRVVSNLISNALKFTPKGGAVTVEAQRVGACVRVAVSDSGIGIPAEKTAELFSKFAAIHKPKDLPRSSTGTGLGLAICKEIIEAHGGRITVESAVGRGAVFAFTLGA